MSDENREFFVKEIEDEPKVKIVKKTVRKKPAPKKQNNVDDFLKDIYDNQDHSSRKIKTKKKGHPIFNFFFTILTLSAIVIALALSGKLDFILNRGAANNGVELTVEGPDKAEFGATTTYNIIYKNSKNVDLKNVVINAKYPAGFQFSSSVNGNANQTNQNEWRFDTLKVKQEGKIEITGKMYGSIDDEQSWRVFLNYTPSNMQAEFQSVATLITKINRAPIKMSLSGPDKAAVGDNVEYKLTLEKNSDNIPSNLQIAWTFPDNFVINSSSLPLDKNKRWNIIWQNSATATEKMELSIKGAFSSTESTNAPQITAILQMPSSDNQSFQIAKSDLTTQMTNNDISFNLAINGSINNLISQPGDLLTIGLNVKNNGQEDLQQVRVKLLLDAPSYKNQSLLDWEKIKDEADGDIQGVQLNDDVRRGQIIWSKKNISALEKIGQNNEAIISLNLPIKTAEATTLSNFKESKINAVAEISYIGANGEQKTIPSNPITITTNSDLAIETRTQTDGKDHYVSWVLSNSFHPLKNIKLSADVYGDVTWNNLENLPAGKINYDPKTKTVVWQAAELPLELDMMAIPMSFTLNKENPTQKTLVSKVKVEAQDAATGETIQFLGDDVPLN